MESLHARQRRHLVAATVASTLAAVTGVAHAALAPASAAPDFTLKNAAGGNLRLSEQRGRVVLVNFWATWCGPCKVEMPHLNRLYEKYKSAGFVLLGVNVDDDPRAAVALAERMGITFPVLLDAGKLVSKLYLLDSMPFTVLIDRDGRVRHLHRGYRDGMERLYEQQIRELVKE
jgi:peroxiredoxin